MIKDRMDLLAIRHSRIIEDPFPEHTEFQVLSRMFNEAASSFRRWLGFVPQPPKPEPISIHAAYRMGYDKAYGEVESALAQKADGT